MLIVSTISWASVMAVAQMFGWLWRRLGIIVQNPANQSDYDAVYGYPKKAVAEWLGWNSQLKAEHDALVRLRQSRRDR